MNFIVVGCGRVGSELSYRLFKSGHQVVVGDRNKDMFNRLHPDFRGRTLEGEGLAEGVLERAGIREAQGLAAVTNIDTLNVAVAYTARTYFDVPIVVARNYDPNLRSVVEAFGLQSVSSTFWGAQRVEELLLNPTQRMVYSAGNGEVEIYEVRVPEIWSGQTLGNLMMKLKGCYPVAVTRSGRSVLPEDTVLLETDDMLNVSASFEGINQLTALFAQNPEA